MTRKRTYFTKKHERKQRLLVAYALGISFLAYPALGYAAYNLWENRPVGTIVDASEYDKLFEHSTGYIGN